MSESQLHDKAVINMLRDDPALMEDYLRAAFDELDEPSGEAALLIAMRHVAEAHGGIRKIAEETGLSRESLYRTLSERGNPRLKTLNSMLHALGLRLTLTATID